MPESFGTRLRQRREQQHVALASIAAQTKIKPSLLEALERDDVSLWPSGIFRRAYLRAYAKAIGVDPDAAVREFLELYPDPSETVEPIVAVATATSLTDPNAGPPTRLRNLVGSTIASLPWFKPVAKETRQPGIKNGHAHDAKNGNGNGHSPEVDLPRLTDGTFNGAQDPVAIAPTAPVLAPASRFDTARSNGADPQTASAGVTTSASEAASTSPAGPDIVAAASLCTAFCRVESVADMPRLLNEAARILDAAGIIVWLWDCNGETLRPALAAGYPDTVLAQLPVVHRDANNATAAAFRSADACTVAGSERSHGALVIPIVKASGCIGVLAIELRHGGERAEATKAVASIIAAQLAHALSSPIVFDDEAPDAGDQPVHARRTT